MASIGPLSPATATGASWSSPGNVGASDDAYASYVSASGSASIAALSCRNFGFAIPVDATIDGVLVEIEAKASHAFSTVYLDQVLLTDGGFTTYGTNESDSHLTTVDVYYSRGSGSDDWSAGLTPAEVNSSAFSVLMWIRKTSSEDARTFYIDHVRVTIYYSLPGGTTVITAGPAISYGSLTRLGPNNTPATVTFTATDVDTTGTDALSYEIRNSATPGAGALAGAGTCTSGVPKAHDITYASVSAYSDGGYSLYLHISNGTTWVTSSAFTLSIDSTPPTVGAIVQSPNPVVIS